jgi:hypothetical protein
MGKRKRAGIQAVELDTQRVRTHYYNRRKDGAGKNVSTISSASLPPARAAEEPAAVEHDGSDTDMSGIEDFGDLGFSNDTGVGDVQQPTTEYDRISKALNANLDDESQEEDAPAVSSSVTVCTAFDPDVRF